MTLYHLEEILNIGKPTLEWIHDFMKNQEFCNYRFKYMLCQPEKEANYILLI